MYAPSQNLLEVVSNAFPAQLFPWDDYFARMAECDFQAGRADIPAVKSFFIREAPFGGSYAILGGLTAFLAGVMSLRFDNETFVRGMSDMGYDDDFIVWLKERKHLRIKVYAPPEGSVFFPNEPVVTVAGPLADIRLVEGILTEALNFPTLSLTKWNRLVRAVRPGHVLEFARRRSQHAFKTTLYAMLAGCFSTSNSEIRRYADVPVGGTMGHEFVQSFGDVRKAFDVWLRYQPSRPVGLVDTKHCLLEDFPAWLDAVHERREAVKSAHPSLWGWRNDSGDLAFLTIEQHQRFLACSLAKDEWFRTYMHIVLTNELDEYAASSIIGQIRTQAGQAGYDAEDIIRRIIWAAGTKPGTVNDQPSLNGIAKLMEINGRPSIKLALDGAGKIGPKTSIPGFNFSALIRNKDGLIECVLIYPARRYTVTPDGLLFDTSKNAPLEELTVCHPNDGSSTITLKDYAAEVRQRLVFDTDTGEGSGLTDLWDNPTIQGVRLRVQEEVDMLPWWMTRLQKPNHMKVSVTPDLFNLRQRMIERGLLLADYTPW